MTAEEFVLKFENEIIDKDAIDEYAKLESLSPTEALDQIALVVAEKYSEGAWSFDLCDEKMNDVWILMVHEYGNVISDDAATVFEAFDVGEYTRSSDPPGSDPKELYTKPMVSEFLAMKRAEQAGGHQPDAAR